MNGTNGTKQFETDWDSPWNAQRGADREKSQKELLGEAIAVLCVAVFLWVLFGPVVW